MGASQSSVDYVTTVLNKVTTNTMAKISNKTTASINQKNVFKLEGVTLSGSIDAVQENEAKINVGSVSQAAQTGELQSALSADIMAQIEQETSSQVGVANTVLNMKKDIQSIIENNITTETVNEAFANVNQENLIDLKNVTTKTGADIKVRQTNVGEAISSLMSQSATEISALLKTEFKDKTTVKQKTTQELPSLMGLFGGVGLILVGILFILGVGLFLGKSLFSGINDFFQEHKKLILIGFGILIVAIIGVVVYNIVEPKEENTEENTEENE